MSTPLESFFEQFSDLGFTYKPEATAHKNFKRLQRASHWDKKSTELHDARAEFKVALVLQFNVVIGKGTALKDWQKLCTLIDITPLPGSIPECQVRVAEANVNIVDLLESVRTGEPVRKFATVKELSEYSIKSKKIFPKESAYAGGLLSELLRELFSAYQGKGGKGNAGRRRRRARKRAAAAAAAAAQSQATPES